MAGNFVESFAISRGGLDPTAGPTQRNGLRSSLFETHRHVQAYPLNRTEDFLAAGPVKIHRIPELYEESRFYTTKEIIKTITSGSFERLKLPSSYPSGHPSKRDAQRVGSFHHLSRLPDCFGEFALRGIPAPTHRELAITFCHADRPAEGQAGCGSWRFSLYQQPSPGWER